MSGSSSLLVGSAAVGVGVGEWLMSKTTGGTFCSNSGKEEGAKDGEMMMDKDTWWKRNIKQEERSVDDEGEGMMTMRATTMNLLLSNKALWIDPMSRSF